MGKDKSGISSSFHKIGELTVALKKKYQQLRLHLGEPGDLKRVVGSPDNATSFREALDKWYLEEIPKILQEIAKDSSTIQEQIRQQLSGLSESLNESSKIEKLTESLNEFSKIQELKLVLSSKIEKLTESLNEFSKIEELTLVLLHKQPGLTKFIHSILRSRDGDIEGLDELYFTVIQDITEQIQKVIPKVGYEKKSL
jgi:predicted RNase H-like nuclease (RuvC/YqgF family)